MADLLSRSMWYSLQDCAQVHGLRLTAILTGSLELPQGGPRARDVHRLLTPENFDGALVFTGVLGEYSRAEVVQEYLDALAPLPVVSLGVPFPGVSSVAIDQGLAIEELVRHLYHTHGHRRFAFVEGPPVQVEALQRRDAFLRTVADLQIPSDHVHLISGDYSKAAGAAALRAVLALDNRPSALVCANDAEAFGAIEEAAGFGVRVPEDLAVTGFDDVDLASLQEPELTTARQPIVEQTGRAAELLVKLIEGDAPGTHLVERGRLIFRGSCGCHDWPEAEVVVPRSSAEMIEGLLGVPGNASVGFLRFAQGWVLDYTTAFEHYLVTGDRRPLRTQWLRYMGFPGLDLEKGLSFRTLFAGVEALFGHRPGFEAVFRDNLYLAGEAESRKGIDSEQKTRDRFYRLHLLETALAQVTSRDALAHLADPGWGELGIYAVTLFSGGFAPFVVPVFGPRQDAVGGERLPPSQDHDPPGVHRVVVSLELDGTYLGYAVFWAAYSKVSIYELLGNQFALALHRIQLLERLSLQSKTLERSLDEARQMQKQLVETEKVASLGRLVAGVAHELNTPLGTGITGSSFLLERFDEVRSQLAAGTLSHVGLDNFLAMGTEALDGVVRNLMKAGELVQVFKGLGVDHGQGEWKPVELIGLFTDLGGVYRSTLAKSGIGLRLHLPAAETWFFTQPSALVQVCRELVDNTLDHAFDTVVGRDHQVVLHVEVDDENLRLAVTDNGRGIGDDDRRHLFEPLFTTKRASGHAGLGLHLAFQLVVHTLGGQMTVASQPGEGTCFLCLIPVKKPD